MLSKHPAFAAMEKDAREGIKSSYDTMRLLYDLLQQITKAIDADLTRFDTRPSLTPEMSSFLNRITKSPFPPQNTSP